MSIGSATSVTAAAVAAQHRAAASGQPGQVQHKQQPHKAERQPSPPPAQAAQPMTNAATAKKVDTVA